ncbi:hypothetical protein ACI8AA_08595 [Geodermatophilus sp. SYSU D01180]
MSAPTLPAPRRTSSSPVPPGDGLGIADLLDLLGLESDTLTPLDPPLPGDPADRAPVDPVAVVRGWVRRAADWGAGPQRSWCAW